MLNIGAIISDDEKYRYQLWRIWDYEKPLALWIMLNPSTADGNFDDPTIRRCIKFTHDWGFGGLYVGNLFAYRATNPKELKNIIDPIGEDNIEHLYLMKNKCSKIICAWGNSFLKKINYTFLKQEKLFCLGINKSGEPKHPLYLKSDIKLIDFELATTKESLCGN
jgi:hypothetical protein